MSGALEAAPLSANGSSENQSEDWPKTPEDGIRRWVYIEPSIGSDSVRIYGPQGMVISDEMALSLNEQFLPVAETTTLTKGDTAAGSPNQPAIIGINIKDIISTLRHFGNGHSHVAEDWRQSAQKIVKIGPEIGQLTIYDLQKAQEAEPNRIYIAVGQLTLYDLQEGIIPVPED